MVNKPYERPTILPSPVYTGAKETTEKDSDVDTELYQVITIDTRTFPPSIYQRRVVTSLETAKSGYHEWEPGDGEILFIHRHGEFFTYISKLSNRPSLDDVLISIKTMVRLHVYQYSDPILQEKLMDDVVLLLQGVLKNIRVGLLDIEDYVQKKL